MCKQIDRTIATPENPIADEGESTRTQLSQPTNTDVTYNPTEPEECSEKKPTEKTSLLTGDK